MTPNLNLRDFPFVLYELSRYKILVSPVTPVTSLSVCCLIARHFIALNPPTVFPSCPVAWQQQLYLSRNQHCSPLTQTFTVSSDESTGPMISNSLGIHPETCYVIFRHLCTSTIYMSSTASPAFCYRRRNSRCRRIYWSAKTCCNSFVLLLPLSLAQKETHVLVF